ncbi:MAG TPA: GvpL/GvpF family gas vesicle protein [Pyrinomonadaceae bacterium]|jgi:hypothetical protein|nr:GvpL/GvpF family gas vesicle protein [Pyrinomonadaceae bacterium]
MNLYAYCLSDEMARAAGAGVGGAEVREFECGGVWVLVSEFAGERVGVTRENLLAHNRVVGDVLARTTPLPFRFGTLTSETRLRNYVETNRVSLLQSLGRVRGCVEMSVKILWNAGEVRRAAEETARAASGAGVEGSGAAYLLAKRRALAESEDLRVRAGEIASRLAETLGETVREARVRVRPEEALVVRAAHLVERARLDDYRARVHAARAKLREAEGRGEGLRFLTSGVWPPYSFTDVSA